MLFPHQETLSSSCSGLDVCLVVERMLGSGEEEDSKLLALLRKAR